jgi:polysaccharide biosynthesis transport protein
MLLRRSERIDSAGPSITGEPHSLAAVIAILIGVMRRQIVLIAMVAASAVALGLAYLMTTPPEFTATALVQLDSRRLVFKSDQSADPGYDIARMESQAYVARSERIALSVVKDLHLTEDPEFVGIQPSPVGGLFGSVFHPFAEPKPPSESRLALMAADAFSGRLNVRRIGLSYILEISFTSHDPVRAAEIANAAAQAYIDNQLDDRYRLVRDSNGWMQDRIRELADQSSAAQRAVVEFKNKNDIVDTGGRLTNDQQLAELNSQLVAARTEAAEAKAKLDRIEVLLNSSSPDAPVDATVADSLHSEVISHLRELYLENQRRANDWSMRFGPNHLAVVQTRVQMQELRGSILDELRRIAGTYKSNYDIALRRVASSEAAWAKAVNDSQTTNLAGIALHQLDSNAETSRAVYDNFLQRYMDAIQQLSFPISEASVVAEASPPLRQSHPRPLLVLAISLGGGMVLAVGAGVLRDRWYPVFRSPADVDDVFQTGCLAALPLLNGDKLIGGLARPRLSLLAATPASSSITAADAVRSLADPPTLVGDRPPEPQASRIIPTGEGPLWHVAKAPLSSFTESIRSIKLAADLTRSDNRTKVIGVTSAWPHEGKSTVAGALAILMAQTGARTVLVDCDLRNPFLTRALAPTARLGILDVILEKAEIDDVIWTDESSGLAFLPGVVDQPVAHSVEFLASSRATALMETLRERFENVVVDLSPLIPVVDVRATTQLIDAYVLVVEWGRTRVDQVERALRGAPGLYDSLLGVVLNKTPRHADYPDGSGRAGGYYYEALDWAK